ncbi:MAG: biopolymer transporter ExbD [Porphyromonadaceae bacterium]|nr:biopolymer transporter ExbD [Porphyromonadaceae bacterium]
MSLKRKTRVADSFSMASMTDVIFLLLIFFLVTSTIIVPNAIKVTLPSAAQQPAKEMPSAKVIITPEGKLFLGLDKSAEIELPIEELGLRLGAFSAEHPNSYVAIHADESVPYKYVVRVIGLASQASLKVVLATKITSEQ